MFDFIWDHGFGNVRSQHGDSQRWTDIGLEDAFADFGQSIDKRSIQNWHSGNNKPSIPNIHTLSKIVSVGDEKLRGQWADALIYALRQDPRTSMVKPTNDDGLRIHGKGSKLDTPKKNISGKHIDKHFMVPFTYIKYGVFTFGFLAFFAFAIFLITGQVSRTNHKPMIKVTNMKFCDEKRFSQSLQTCLTNVTNFPKGIPLIYVSFQLMGAPDGQPFERRWYHNGDKFLQRDGFYDAAWEDFTWIDDTEINGSGRYNLRVIVEGRTTTGTFFVDN